MFDALAAGKPVLINVRGWLRKLIEGHGCGYFVDPAHPDRLANALLALARDPNSCSQMGRNARALAEHDFARDQLADQLERVLREMFEADRTGP